MSHKSQDSINIDKNTLMIILYLIERLNGVLGKTHLQKLLFLVNLLSVKKFKEPLTQLKFERYHYGPYCKKIDEYIEHLKNKEFVEQREFPFGKNRGKSKSYVRYYFKHGQSIKKSLFDQIGAEKVILLDEIISSYGNVCLQDILDVVYSLQSVKKSELHTPLEMAKIIKEDNDEVEEIDIF